MTRMTIIIRIGPAAMGILWALVTLFGVILVSSGFFNAFNGLTNFGNITLANTAAISHISGGIIMLIIGLVAASAGYLGIRGRILVISYDTRKNPS